MTNEKKAANSEPPLKRGGIVTAIVTACGGGFTYLFIAADKITMVFGPDGFLSSFSKGRPLRELWETLSNTVPPIALCGVLIVLLITAVGVFCVHRAYRFKSMEKMDKKLDESKKREEEFARLKAQLSQEHKVND